MDGTEPWSWINRLQGKLSHLVWVSPPSQVEVWIQEEPWRRWARKGRSGWRSSTMFDAWHKSLTLIGKVWSWTLCEWWRWYPRKAQDNNHRSRCSSSQELLKKICFGVKSEQIFLSIINYDLGRSTFVKLINCSCLIDFKVDGCFAFLILQNHLSGPILHLIWSCLCLLLFPLSTEDPP